MAKLLVEESKDWITLENLPLLGKLLEARDESGMTALLIASQCQDYAIVELLVEAGADVNATDQDGNTAIILAAANQDISIPSKERSPKIFRVCIHFYNNLNDLFIYLYRILDLRRRPYGHRSN